MRPQDSYTSHDNYEFAEHDPFTRRSKPARPGIRFFNSSGSGFSSRNIVDTDRIHEALLREFSAGEMEKWRPALRMAVEDGVLTVHFPHRFFAQWFAAHVRPRFERALAGVIPVTYEKGSVRPSDSFPEPPPFFQTPGETDLPFGSRFTFENFLANNKNHFPLASAREVAQNTEAKYNPFVLCGESGSGKSFLLRAMANARAGTAGGTVRLTGIEDMHKLYSSRSDARDVLLSADFLAVDDLQDIARHQHLQNELVALFDAFHLRRRQMVFACSGKVARFAFLHQKLKSRLEWGLIVTLKAPDLDIRMRFIQNRCKERGLDLSKDRILLLAQRFGDLRNLEGCLLKLWAYHELVRERISDQDFENILSHLDTRAATPLTPEQIMDEVCASFGVTREDLLSPGRRHELVLARQVGMFLCRKHLGLSFSELGRIFGGRDHSTALYSCKKIEQLQRDDKEIKNRLHDLSGRCLALGRDA